MKSQVWRIGPRQPFPSFPSGREGAIITGLEAARWPSHMCSITLSPNSLHLISVAPSIKRAKS